VPSLDAETAREVLAEFLTVCREHHTTLLIVSHDDAVLDTADRVLDMAALNRARGRRPTVPAGEQE